MEKGFTRGDGVRRLIIFFLNFSFLTSSLLSHYFWIRETIYLKVKPFLRCGWIYFLPYDYIAICAHVSLVMHIFTETIFLFNDLFADASHNQGGAAGGGERGEGDQRRLCPTATQQVRP